MGKGAIVVSLRSKGLGSLNRVTLFDFKFHAVAIVTEVHAWYLQTWLSWSTVPIVHRRTIYHAPWLTWDATLCRPSILL